MAAPHMPDTYPPQAPEFAVNPPNTYPAAGPTLAIPVSGIMNWGSGLFSTAAWTFYNMRHAVRDTAGIDVTQPIVPGLLGVVNSIEDDYAVMSRHIDHYVERYGEQARPFLVGHSYGGLISARYLAERGTDKCAGVLSLGGAHGPARNIPHLPFSAWLFEIYDSRQEEIIDFSGKTMEAFQKRGGQEALALVGTTSDEIVGLESSLPAVPKAARYILSQTGNRPDGFPDAQVFSAPLIEHMSLTFHPAATRLAGRIAAEMTSTESSNVIHLPVRSRA